MRTRRSSFVNMCRHVASSHNAQNGEAPVVATGSSGVTEAGAVVDADEGGALPSSQYHKQASHSGPWKAPIRPHNLSAPTNEFERMVFLRDHSYSKRRPLHDIPWLQQKRRSYLDDAERLYGRKEDWSVTVTDPTTKERLVRILKDYLVDCTTETIKEVKAATHHKSVVERRAAEYRSFVTAGIACPSVLRSWRLREAADEPQATTELQSSADAGHRADSNNNGRDTGDDAGSHEEESNMILRRDRGANADLAQTEAMSDFIAAKDPTVESFSSFPFLRQRALQKENTLDPSLVDWAAKYFPDDNEKTFEVPSSLKPAPAIGVSTDHTTATDGNEELRTSSSEEWSKAKKMKRKVATTGKHRMTMNLQNYLDRTKATFDGQGLFYKVTPVVGQGENVDADDAVSHVPRRIRPLRASELDRLATAKGQSVVKVDWDTVVKARATRKTPEVHKAKERLIRLTRGEDPETI